MFFRLLIPATVILTVVAMVSQQPRELIEIERLDRDGYTLLDEADPAFAGLYPNIVARVDGHPITAHDLVLTQLSTDYDYLDIDPLDWLIDQELLARAAERLGRTPPYEDMVERAVAIERNTTRGLTDAELAQRAERLAARGWPTDNWGESDVVVRAYQRTQAILNMRRAECEQPSPAELQQNPRAEPDCSDVLAEQRELSIVDVYVRWAE